MQIDNQSYRLIPADNAASRALINKLPLSVEMVELNGNEKYVDLAFDLPVGPAVTGTIQAGDVMLYGNNTLVLFYKSFHTTYRYTRIGRIDAPEALEQHDSMKAATVSVTLSPE
ncbi:cyclophilin-like fold protein [Pantoea brenneri]|nr:cyclophilin-like fold protein [Pantoea brenneri]